MASPRVKLFLSCWRVWWPLLVALAGGHQHDHVEVEKCLLHEKGLCSLFLIVRGCPWVGCMLSLCYTVSSEEHVQIWSGNIFLAYPKTTFSFYNTSFYITEQLLVTALLQKEMSVFFMEIRKFPTIIYKWFRNFPVCGNMFWMTLVKAAITVKSDMSLKLTGNVQLLLLWCCHS